MAWTKNEIILNQRETMASNDLFQAVCDEIGAYYANKGLKYSRSRPKVTYKDKELKLEVCFWSSRSNTSGRHITLEIVPNFYSLEIIQQGLSTSKSQIAKGLIIGLSSIFKFKHNDKDNVEKVRQIYGDVISLDNIVYGGDIIRDNHNCNIYGIDEFRFNKIIEFIDNKILYWVEKIKTSEGIVEFIEDRPKGVCLSLLGEGFNSDFVPYCNLKFPELKVEERLRKITNTQSSRLPIG